MNDIALVETMLRDRRDFLAEINQSIGLRQKVRAMFWCSAGMMAIYGALLGSTHSGWQSLSSAVKLPLLFLVTLLICTPVLYLINLLFGANQSLRQSLALVLTAITVIIFW